mgnify:FL=1
MEANVVLWDNKVESFTRLLDFDQFKDLHVVLEDLASQSERAHIDHIHIWVFDRENSSDLRIFLLFELLDGHALHLSHRERIDVNLDAFLVLDVWPAAFKLLLHVTPDSPRLIIQLVHFYFS